MRRLRVSITDSAILVAIVGLICAVPLHFRRYVDRDTCHFWGEFYVARGSELAAMADHPEPWMDPFRKDFRRLSDWQLAKGRRLVGLSRYDEDAEQKRIVGAGMDGFEVAFRTLYKQFEAVAARHGYRRPHIPLGSYPRYEIGAFFTGWPLYAGVILLGGLLFVRWRRKTRRSRPSAESGDGGSALRRVRRGGMLLIGGELVVLYSLAWSAIAGRSPAPVGAGPWPYLLAGMFEPTDGHCLLTLLALAASVAGIALNVSAIREWWRGRRIDVRMPALAKRADSPDLPRADGPETSA